MRVVTKVCEVLDDVFDSSKGFWIGLLPDVGDDAGIDDRVFSEVGSEYVVAWGDLSNAAEACAHGRFFVEGSVP